MSATTRVLALIIVFAPLTVKLPPTTTFPFNVVLPAVFPMAKVVAEPAKFSVVTFVLTRLNVALDVVMEVLILGLVFNTTKPVPLSSVNAAAKFAEEGVVKKVAIPVAKPDTPVEIGRPVALVKVANDGIPIFGVTNTGELENTKFPVPVSSETEVAI